MTCAPLSDEQLKKLKNAIRAIYSAPFVDDIEDFIWESIFAYVKDIEVDDPFSTIREKRLFDITDFKTGCGWSAKTASIQTKFIKPSLEFEVVIQRADILGKNEELTLHSSEQDLGNALLLHWRRKFEVDSVEQKVSDARICFLLKQRPSRFNFAFFETPLRLFTEDEISWRWSNENKKGLQGFLKSDNTLIYRWYPSGNQLFERFVIPKSAALFSVPTKRLMMKPIIDLLLTNLEQYPAFFTFD